MLFITQNSFHETQWKRNGMYHTYKKGISGSFRNNFFIFIGNIVFNITIRFTVGKLTRFKSISFPNNEINDEVYLVL